MQHIIIEVKSLNWTNQSTVSVTTVNTGFCNDVSHSDAFSLEFECTRHSCLSLQLVKDTYILSMNHKLLKDGRSMKTPAKKGGHCKRPTVNYESEAVTEQGAVAT
jgi:hypothetical protein